MSVLSKTIHTHIHTKTKLHMIDLGAVIDTRTNNEYEHNNVITKLHMIVLVRIYDWKKTLLMLEIAISNSSVRFEYHMVYWPCCYINVDK
jgi:hypothetical protein